MKARHRQGSGLLVSHLSNKGRDYLVIVSHDPLNSQTVSLKFRNHWTVRTVNPIAEVKKFTKSDDGTRTVYSRRPSGRRIHRFRVVVKTPQYESII